MLSRQCWLDTGASENLEHGVETVLWTPECQGWKHPFENSCPAWKVPSLGPLNSELELAAFSQGETHFLKKDQSHCAFSKNVYLFLID